MLEAEAVLSRQSDVRAPYASIDLPAVDVEEQFTRLQEFDRDDDREVVADGDMMSTLLLLSRKKPSSLRNKVVRGFPEDKMWWM